jgi:membrane protein implicated in regulation of membrane protease activity
MGGLLRYFVLKAQVRAGLSAGIVVWAVLAAAAAAVAAIFLLTAAYIWVAHRYGAVRAGLAMAALFVVIAIIAAIASLLSRRSNMRRAQLELAERRRAGAGMFDPKLLAMGFQLGQSIGWRKLASLAAVAVLAAGLGNEWLGRRSRSQDADASEGD